MPSEIAEFYKGSTVLLTGGTGFLGRIFIEKLLRSCPDIKKLYLIVRPKKGKDVQTRYQNIFEGVVFDHLRRNDVDFAERVTLIAGDCSELNLGLSEEDRNKLIEEVDCIIHAAATVRFDEKLKIAINVNVRATRDLIEMAKKMIKLRAMVYISTAFSQCTRPTIDEVIHDVPISGKNLIRLSEILDDDQLEEITPNLVGKYPNSYILTKAVAEQMIKTEGKDLPIAVVRPSIVIGSVREPVAGWNDNIYGANGVILGVVLGIFRSLHGDSNTISEMVPVDYSVNCALATAWDITTNNKRNSINDDNNISVYNFVSAPEARVIWDDAIKLSLQYGTKTPSNMMVWFPDFKMRKCKYHHQLVVIVSQIIPAYIFDFVSVCMMGKKPMAVKAMKKIIAFGKGIEYFVMNEWMYKNDNVRSLWKKMNKKDKAVFEFSMANFNWDDYFDTYMKGLRVYILKDPLETLPQAKVRYFKLKIAHYTVLAVLTLIMLLVVRFIVNLIF